MGSRSLITSYVLPVKFIWTLFCWWPYLAFAKTQSGWDGVTDEEANEKSLDSLYIGTINAHWESSEPSECSRRKLGPYSGARLTIGKYHHWNDPNPFFLSIYGADKKTLSCSMQSSISSAKQNETWWSLQAEKKGDGYIITGTLENPAENQGGYHNAFMSAIDERDDDECGEGEFHNWKHGDHTRITGYVSPRKSKMKLTGKVKSKKRAGRAEFLYTLQFEGEWVDTSAELSVKSGGPAWPEPGTGPPLPPAKFIPIGPFTESSIVRTKPTFTSKRPTRTTTNKSSSTKASTATPTVPATTVTTTMTWSPTPTSTNSTPTSEPASSSGLPRGAVAGIVIGSAAVLAGLILGILWLRAWNERRKVPKAYPELAYIYSTPARTGGNNVGGNSGNVFGMGRRAAYNQIPQQDASMPSTAYMGSGNTIGYTGGRYDDQGQPMI